MFLLSPALRLLQLLVLLLRQCLALPFGSLQWRPPAWLAWLGAHGARFSRAMGARPLLSAVVVAALVTLGAGGWYGWKWWQARPKPVAVKFTVTEPARTEIENNKKPNALLLKFDRGVAPLAQIGKEVAQGIEVVPQIVGTWRWISDSQLEFRPKDDWPVGAEYKVSLARTTMAPQIRLAAWDFAFKSPAFMAQISSAEFYQDPTNPTLKKAVIGVNFSHPVDTVAFEKRIDLHMAGAAAGVLGIGAEKTRFVVSYDKLKLNAYIHSQPLTIPKDDTRIEVAIDKGLVSARGGKPTDTVLTKRVDIPGL